jgi:hypothetical protein
VRGADENRGGRLGAVVVRQRPSVGACGGWRRFDRSPPAAARGASWAPFGDARHSSCATRSVQRGQARDPFLSERFSADVRAYVESCDECRKAAHVNRTPNNFGDSESGSGSDERVFAAREGYQIDTWHVPELRLRVLVAVFLFTDYKLLLSVEDGWAAESARAVASAFSVLGAAPRFVKTDGGSEFGGAFGARMRSLGVRVVRGTPYNSDAQARVERKIGEANGILRRLLMHARASGSPDVAELLLATQTAINAVTLPQVTRERVGGAMTRHGAFFGSEPRLELRDWQVASDEEDAPVGVGAPGVDLHAQLVRVRLALAVAYEIGSRNGDFATVALSGEAREALRERRVEASFRSRAAALDPPFRPAAGDLVWRRVVAPGSQESGKMGSHVFSYAGPLRGSVGVG